jgi:hypothetical protein
MKEDIEKIAEIIKSGERISILIVCIQDINREFNVQH